jgi:hypothetical protein
MKNKFIISFGLWLISLSPFFGQTISLIPNPKVSEKYRYCGFYGEAIDYNNSLFLIYEYFYQRFQLARFDGDSIILIPCPDTTHGHFDGGPGSLVIYKNELYWTYPNKNGNYHFMKYNNSSCTIYPNPDTTDQMYGGVCGHLFEYKNELYFIYEGKRGAEYSRYLAKFDGVSIQLYSNPYIKPYSWPEDVPIIFRDELYWGFLDGNFVKVLEDTLELLTNPYTNEQGLRYPVVFKDNLYLNYLDTLYNGHLVRYDGNGFAMIENPDSGGISLFNTAIYQGYLFGCYNGGKEGLQLARFDGNVIELVSNDILSKIHKPRDGFYNFIVFKDKLFFTFMNDSGIGQMGMYDGEKMCTVPNPDTVYHKNNIGIMGRPFIWKDNLFWYYGNNLGVSQLARYDGIKLRLIPNPDPGYMDYAVFKADPIAYKDALYFRYVDSTDNFRLANLVYQATDIGEINSENILIYPNPASDIITIELPGIVTGHDVSLYSLTGALMIKKCINRDYEQLDIGEIPPGVYILKIKGKEISIVRKIIKI